VIIKLTHQEKCDETSGTCGARCPVAAVWRYGHR